MTNLAILAFAIILALPAAPRCHIEAANGRYWRVCPCAGVTYQCQDWWPVQRVRGRWIR